MKQRAPLFLLIIGLLLAGGGAGMRVYASITLRLTEDRLLHDRPASPNDIPPSIVTFASATVAPVLIRLPAYDLYNTLETVAMWQTDAGELWQVSDAGWHLGAKPGDGANVVIAGHSPSHTPEMWRHSIFRQLAYLHPGDLIEVQTSDHVYRYAVVRVFAIPLAEAETTASGKWIAPGNTERLTLVTCWPPHDPITRVLVIANPVSETKS
jgi:LPXTG-site transpeptidase (sortase) family protein